MTSFWEPMFRPEDKEQAKEARRYWRGVKRHGLYSAGVLGGLTTAGVLIAPIPAVACLVAAWIAESMFDSHEDLAGDPARFDYNVVTGPVERRLYTDPLGTSAIELATLEVGKATLSAAAEVNALIRAVERAAGAAQREQAQAFSDQIEAAKGFKAEAVHRLSGLTGPAESFADTLESELEESYASITDARARSTLGAGPLERILPAETLALSYRLGISIRLLREHVATPKSLNPIVDLGEAVRKAASASAELGTGLESWTVSPEQ